MGLQRTNKKTTRRHRHKDKTVAEHVKQVTAQNVVRACMTEYGHYAIENRALPDIRDGIKPSVRRILWSMYSMGAIYNRPPVKSGRIVGEVIGKYHPHGDASVYNTLVLLAHDKDPLIIPDGNFGDIQSYQKKSAASFRYTECRLSQFAEQMFDDINAVPFVDNYDATLKEPTVLPVKVPLLLVKGTDGIAVGISTTIPPHNLNEVVDACCYLVDHPEASTKDLCKFIKGPDYGVGSILSNKEDLLNLYETGEGSLTYSSDYSIEKSKKGATLVITAFAPEMRGQRSKLLDATTRCFESGLIDSPIIDESSLSGGYRYTIRFSVGKIIQNQILPLLHSKIYYKWYCLASDGKPTKFNLKSVLSEFIAFRREVERNRLRKAKRETKKTILALIAKYKAAINISVIAEIIQKNKDNKKIEKELFDKLKLTPYQVSVILSTNMGALTRANIFKLTEKIKETKIIYKIILDDLAHLDRVVKNRMLEMKKFGSMRGTKLSLDIKNSVFLDTAQKYWVSVDKCGKIITMFDPPIKSTANWSYLSIDETSNDIAIVYDTNIVTSTDLSYAYKYKAQPGKIVGVSTKQYCLVIGESGYVLFPTKQRRNIFNAFKKNTFPLLAIGVDDTDTIIIQTTDNKLVQLATIDLKITRPNVLAKPLGVNTGIKNVYIVPKNGILVSDSGKVITTKSTKKKLFVVGGRNLVVARGGRRGILDKKETLNKLKEKDLVLINVISN